MKVRVRERLVNLLPARDHVLKATAVSHKQIKAPVRRLLSPLSVLFHQSVPLGLRGSRQYLIELLIHARMIILCDDCEFEIFVGNMLA